MFARRTRANWFSQISSLLFISTILFPYSTMNSIPSPVSYKTLSPSTTLAPGFSETERKAIEENIAEQADAARGLIDPNIFQGYDVRGIGFDEGKDKANLRPVDAFLIAEAIAYDYQKKINEAWSKELSALVSTTTPETFPQQKKPRILVTGDHRITSQPLVTAAAMGAFLQGFEVHYDSGQVPTGGFNMIGLRDNYDVIIQITGSHNPAHHNGMKIAVRQNEEGAFDPDRKLGALYGNRGKRPFELKSIEEIIKSKAEEIRKARQAGTLRDIFGKPMDVSGSYLEKVPGRPRFGWLTGEYVNELKARFGRLKTPRRVVFDAGNGMGSAAIPVLENQGHKFERGLFLEVKGRPDHPADPSKDTEGVKPYAESGCRACIEAVREVNREVPEGELPAVGVMTDGDGDRSGMVDEEGKVVRPSAIATLIYRRFILENKDVLAELEQKLGKYVTLALDVRSSSVMEQLTGVIDMKGDLIKKGTYEGVRGYYIPAGYPSHRDHVAKEIAKLRELQRRIRNDDFIDKLGRDTSLANRLDQVIYSYVSAEASGHYFAATDESHPETMIDDGIYFAARVLEILDTWNDLEGKEPSIAVPHKDVYLLKDIFSQESIPTLPSPDEPRFTAPKSVDRRYEIIASLQSKIQAEKENPQGLFRGKIANLVTMNQVVDGVRIMFEDGSAFLIRTSNTSSVFTSMVEADSWTRVVEILEDALKMMEPYKKDFPKISTKDLEEKLGPARKKSAVERAKKVLQLQLLAAVQPLSRETLVDLLQKSLAEIIASEKLDFKPTPQEIAQWVAAGLEPLIQKDEAYCFKNGSIVYYVQAPDYKELERIRYQSVLAQAVATGEPVSFVSSPDLSVEAKNLPLPKRIETGIQFDDSNAAKFIPNFPQLSTILMWKGEAYLQVVRKILQDKIERAKAWLAWMTMHELPDVNVDEIQQVADKLMKFEDVVFVGIGGSDFGGQALHQIFNSSQYNLLPREKRGGRPRVHFINTVDANDVKDLEGVINYERTAFVVISKSGSTEETKTAFEYFRKEVTRHLSETFRDGLQAGRVTPEWLREHADSRFAIITDLGMKEDGQPKSLLRTEFWRDGKSTALAELSVPDGVGGRYSVGSAVGLLPAAVAGIDIRQFVEGLKIGHDLSMKSAANIQNIAMRLAIIQHLALLQGRTMHYFFPFGNRFNNLSKWYEQLVEESLGKTYPDGSKVDLITKPTVGTRDHHSFVQNLLGGDPNSKFVIFIETEKYGPDEDISGDDGIHMDVKLAATLKGTRKAATDVGIPNVTIKIPSHNEKDIATLMYVLEASIAFWGEAFLELGGQTFLQDQVELYKKATKEALKGIKPRRREPEDTAPVEQAI